jgi:Lrp/AsnC family leucine-responsive transcriptional regulator
MSSEIVESPGPRRRGGQKLDLLDRRILSALREDGRLTVNELAEKVGLSASPCWTRVKRLEATGAIARYAAILDHGTLGLAEMVFVEVTLDKHDEKVLRSFGESLARVPEVIEAHLVSGDYDYLVKVVVAGTSDYERFLHQTLYRIEGIRHTRSVFVLRTLKNAISVDPLLVPADAG